jgi:hypothetical protein
MPWAEAFRDLFYYDEEGGLNVNLGTPLLKHTFSCSRLLRPRQTHNRIFVRFLKRIPLENARVPYLHLGL